MPKPTLYQRTLARDIYRRRKALNWSRRLLAHIARVRLIDVARIENPHDGDTVSDETVKALAAALCVKDYKDLGLIPAEDPDVPLAESGLRSERGAR